MQQMNLPREKEDRRVRRTKKLLTQALTQLLQEKPVNKISVQELTDLADMNRGTFYRYYRDAFDMLDRIEDKMLADLEAIVSKHENDDIGLRKKEILLDAFHFIEENQDMCRVLLIARADMDFLHRLNLVIREKCLKMWPDEQEKTDGTFDYRYNYMIFGWAGICRVWLKDGCQEPAEKMAELAAEIIR